MLDLKNDLLEDSSVFRAKFMVDFFPYSGTGFNGEPGYIEILKDVLTFIRDRRPKVEKVAVRNREGDQR